MWPNPPPGGKELKFKSRRICFTITVNGQPEEDKSKATSVAADKTKSAKTPDSKPGKKRDRTPRKEIKVYTVVIGTSCLVGCY